MNLRRILPLFWPETISNQPLAHCNQDSMGTCIIWWPCRWIWHVIRREPGNMSCTTLGEAETRTTQEHLALNCRSRAQEPPSHLGSIQKLAQNRQKWGTIVAALHASQHNEPEWVSHGMGIGHPTVCSMWEEISFIWSHILLIHSYEHQDITNNFELIAIGRSLRRLKVSFWHEEICDGLGNQCEVWLVDGFLWKPLINHSSNSVWTIPVMVK